MKASVLIFNPVTGNNAFVGDLSKAVQATWKRSVRLQGGYWQATFQLRNVPPQAAEWWLYQALGYRVIERAGSPVTWEGLVYEVDMTYKGIRRKSSLGNLYNAIKAQYTDTNNEAKETAYITNDSSIARYGRRELIMPLDATTSAAVTAQVQTALNQYSQINPVPISIDNPGETIIDVRCCGYVFTANWQYNSTANSPGTVEDETVSIVALDTAYSLANDDVKKRGITVADRADLDDPDVVIYSLGSDYEIDYGAGTITALTDGDITVGQTVYVNYSYAIEANASDWLSETVTTDCEFLEPVGIASNTLQVEKLHSMPTRAYSAVRAITDLGDTSGNPYRFYVGNNRQASYQPIDFTARYAIIDGKIYTSNGLVTNPYTLKPGVYRDYNYPVKRSQQGSLLEDVRDMLVDEVEVGPNGQYTLKPSSELYAESAALAAAGAGI